jgi:hypothetical protein
MDSCMKLFTKDYYIKLISLIRPQFRPILSESLGMETGFDIFVTSFPGVPVCGQRLKLTEVE